jgi:hypothetical protein
MLHTLCKYLQHLISIKYPDVGKWTCDYNILMHFHNGLKVGFQKHCFDWLMHGVAESFQLNQTVKIFTIGDK